MSRRAERLEDEEASQPGAERYHDDVASDEDTLLPPESVEGLPQDNEARRDQSKRHPLLARVADSIPSPLKSASRSVVTWVKGPQPPRIYKIKPYLPYIQEAPLRLLDRYTPKRMQRFWLLISYYFVWILCFVLILQQSSFASDVKGYGPPIRLGCTATFWGKDNDCGINGDQCRPFGNSSFAFRCPAGCIKTQVWNPHAVGDQDVVYKPLVIGGPNDETNRMSSNVYRGDSFICGAAIHAGFIESEKGGCGVVELVGDQHHFPGSDRNGIDSIEFDSYFPQSFSFKDGTQAQCKDLRWPLLAVSVFFTSILSLFTTSPAVFFWSIAVGLFFQTGLASDPPNLTNYYSLVSTALGRFLPAAFVLAVIYRYCVVYQLQGLTAQFEKTVLWLGAAWVGALNNYTFDRIPIQRLTPHDIKAQPGAIPALIIVVLSIFFIALGQAYAFRVEGRMPRYLVVYSLFVVGLLAMVAVPHMNVRIHHYILAILLLPGTAFQNRPSLLYQGLLVGLFINGIARWGFDSILQTPAELLGDAPKGSLLPHVPTPTIGANNVTFTLGPFPPPDKKGRTYDGISVLVNDVERFRGYEDFDIDYLWHDGQRNWTWHRHTDPGAEGEVLPEYFRFAYLRGNSVADYTKAGKWESNGDWVPMKDGPSKI